MEGFHLIPQRHHPFSVSLTTAFTVIYRRRIDGPLKQLARYVEA
jgi:hypothetical protein